MHVHSFLFSCTFLAGCLVFCAACISPGTQDSLAVPTQAALVTQSGEDIPATPFYPFPPPTTEVVLANTTHRVPAGTPAPVTTT
jgi:hypothetical protein